MVEGEKKVKKVLFLDRDGIINCVVRNEKYEYDSPQTVEEVSLVNGIEKLIGWSNINKILVVEITNQPAVAKGKITMKVCTEIEDKIDKLLFDKNVHIDKKYICYHHPNGVVPELKIDCDCRKPKPGMLLQAEKDLDIDLKNSVMMGDRDWDVMAGKAAGCKTILYLFNEDSPEKIKFAMESNPDYKVLSMDEALSTIEKIFLCKQ